MTANTHVPLKNEQKWIPTTDVFAQTQSEWSENKAHQLAAQAGLKLSEAHWEVISYVRDYYREHGFVRRSRELARALNRRFHDQGGKRYLYRLFHGGPVFQACRIGGLPLPENCVDRSFGTTF